MSIIHFYTQVISVVNILICGADLHVPNYMYLSRLENTFSNFPWPTLLINRPQSYIALDYILTRNVYKFGQAQKIIQKLICSHKLMMNTFKERSPGYNEHNLPPPLPDWYSTYQGWSSQVKAYRLDFVLAMVVFTLGSVIAIYPMYLILVLFQLLQCTCNSSRKLPYIPQ